MSESTTNPRSVKEIQAELMTAAEALRQAASLLHLVPLMTELERAYPAAMVEEAIQSLERAARKTPEDVRVEWIKEKLQGVRDPSSRALLELILSRPPCRPCPGS